MYACFVFSKRFDIEAEYFRQEGHGQLGKENTDQPKPEGSGLEGDAEVIGNTRSEEVGQRSEEEVEGANEF